jgi:thymidine phosphorylase
MITAQGGDVDAPLPKAKHSHTVVAPESGTLLTLDALQVGVASWRLGAGRERKEDAVQFGAGIELHAQVGSQVVAGAPLMTLFTDDEPRFARALDSLENSFSIGSGSVERKIVIDRIS